MTLRPYFAGSLAVLGLVAWHALGCSEYDLEDAVAPSLTIDSPANLSTVNGASVIVTGTATDDKEITGIGYQVNGGAETMIFAGGAEVRSHPFSFSAPLAAGENVIVVGVADGGGNETQREIRVRRDNTPPSVQITSPANNSQVTTQNVTVVASVTDDQSVARVTYMLNGGAPQDATIPASSSNVAVSIPVTGLTTGTNTITVTGHDAANNTASATLTLTVQQATVKTANVPYTLPALTIKRLADGTHQAMTAILVVGDHEEDGSKTFQAFLTYEFGAEVQAATAVESARITVATGTDPVENPGDPFAHNGSLCVQRAATMVLNDDAQPTLTAEQCSVVVMTSAGTATIDVKSLVDEARAAGGDEVLLRFRFTKSVGGNGATDYRFLTVSPMTVTYR